MDQKIFSRSVCRACLDSNVAMYSIANNIEFRVIYEKLANTKRNIGDAVLCYICYSQLQNSCRFSKLCKKSEQVLVNLVDNGFQISNETVQMLNYSNGMQKKYSICILPLSILPPPRPTHALHSQEVYVKEEKIEPEENCIDGDEMGNDEGFELHPNFKDNVTDNIDLKSYWDLNSETNINANFQKDNKDSEIHGNEKHLRETLFQSVNDELSDTNSTLLSHFQTHKLMKKRDLHCDKCSKTFTKSRSFNRHVIQHRGRLHACNICDKSFYIKENLDRHFKIHTGVRPYSCDLCCKTFIQKVHLKSHMKVHIKAKPFSCHICKETLSDTPSLKLHYQVHSKEVRVKRNNPKLRNFKIHGKPSCDICKKTLADKLTLMKHMKLHTGERPYSCNLCDKAYIQSGGLKKHMKSHLKVKPTQTQVCHVCGKICSKRRLLTMHMKIHNRTFICDICNKLFSSLGSLRLHMPVHTGEKPHSCNICSKRFSLKSNLHQHLRVHTEEKPFKCHDCGKTFSQKICLVKHTRVHTGIKPFACNQCDKKYTQKNGLTYHQLRTHHK